MNNVEIARIIGTFALILCFLIEGLILSHENIWKKYGRASGIWIVVYVYFLIALRVMLIFHWGTQNQLSIVSGWTAIIPLVGIILHMIFRGREDKPLFNPKTKK